MSENVFPSQEVEISMGETSLVGDAGLTKRELFAVLITHAMVNLAGSNGKEKWIAEVAVKQADALIKELNEPATT